MADNAGIRNETLAWILKFFEACDSLNAEFWLNQFMTEGAAMKSANDPELKGRQTILNALEASKFRSSLESMKHIILHFDFTPDRIYQQVEVTYVVKGDPTHEGITIPGLAVSHRRKEDGGKIHRFEVYIDRSPVLARIREVAGEKAA